MTTTRTYKIIEHFKAGKMVIAKYHDGRIVASYELRHINSVMVSILDGNYTFRLINKKGRRG